MTISTADGEALWDKFLTRWPLEKLGNITLEEYSKAGSTDSFTYWLESITENLGSIWGGSSFKFGVYSRNDQSVKEDGAGRSYSTKYAWYSKYGSTAEEAFEKVLQEIIKITTAARSGDLSQVDAADLGEAVKWKLAFLYQNQDAPIVLPIYKAENLRAALGQGSNGLSCSELHRRLMLKRNGVELFTYGDELWRKSQDMLAQKQTLKDVTGVSMPEFNNEKNSPPLNQILYGPPGTGKTYATIEVALRILDPEFLAAHKDDRTALKTKFDSFTVPGSEYVHFVTFHQSFSYEDFVEGLRAITNEEKQLEYVVEPGVFKRICDNAITQNTESVSSIRSNPRIWKISINGSGSSPTKTYCLNHGEARIGWGEAGDLNQASAPNEYYQSLSSGNQGTLRYFSEEIVPGDILLCLHSAEAMVAVGVVTGDYRYEQTVPQDVMNDYNHVRPVKWLYRNLNLPILPLNDNKQFTLKTVYSMDRITWGDLLAYIEKSGAKPTEPTVVLKERKPHVLIIDEINRGNISRIFGELITLIEPSKRSGSEEALTVTLPYSKKPFSVPSNVYLIGTMNTADRSLASLDIALRRRFTFKEMPPKPELLDNINIEGVNIGELLRTMNERIEVLLDRDHCLGHAYFVPLKNDNSLEKLASIFQQQIIPLLEEYFFEDWERIAWVLNDQNKKDKTLAFIQKAPENLTDLFGSDTADKLQNNDRRWRINEDTFANIESYRAIVRGNS